MTSYSIGYRSEDGDFAILATLNNNDGLVQEELFDRVLANLVAIFGNAGLGFIECLERQDAPDYVDLGGCYEKI